jgi:hypothetical protein
MNSRKSRGGPWLMSIGRRAGPATMVLALIVGGQSVEAAGDMQHPIRLTGELFVAGATLVDPPPDEPTGTHAYLHLTGAAARRVFDALKAKEKTDACVPGRRLKAAGPVVCSVRGKVDDAYCDFALDLTRGVIASGSAC